MKHAFDDTATRLSLLEERVARMEASQAELKSLLGKLVEGNLLHLGGMLGDEPKQKPGHEFRSE